MSIDTVESSRELAPGEPLLPGLLAWELLGGGSHGESWLAWSEDLWSPVVVKLPRPDEVSDAGVWEDLLLEVRAHEGVRHPGFQRLWRADLEAEVPHLVLEYVEGPSLDTLREDGVLTVPDVVLLGLQLAASLRHLHRRRLVHLDVKPGNVVVRQGRAVLLDLGALTPAGRVYGRHDAPGTTTYMSPELLDDGVVSPAGDVFALGVTLRELLEKAPKLPVVDDLLDRMTSPQAVVRPTDDEVLAVLHGELTAVGSSLWPAWADPARS
jgi:eukaryotic-like serine/threonine-protein kinase